MSSYLKMEKKTEKSFMKQTESDVTPEVRFHVHFWDAVQITSAFLSC